MPFAASEPKAGQIRELDARIHDLRREQGHIDATLKMFDPDAQPRLIKPVQPIPSY
jgi:hypothetical protein